MPKRIPRAERLSTSILRRMKEIDPTKGKDDDRSPDGDDYNDLWDAILDEIKHFCPEIDVEKALKYG